MEHAEPYKFIRWRVGQNIKVQLDRNELTQSGLARMISKDRGNINRLLAGGANPSLDLLVKIADGLGVPLTDLFYGLDGVAPHGLKVNYDGEQTPGNRS